MIYGVICLLTAALSAGGTWLLCKYLLRRLGMRELGVKDIPAAARHIPGEDKYVPRCGGLLPCGAALVSAAVMVLIYSALSGSGGLAGVPRLSGLQRMYIWGGLLLAPLSGAVGFLEDYALVFRGLPRALAGWQRLLIQGAVASAYLAAIWLSGDRGEGIAVLPFAGEVRMGFWYYPLCLVLILAVTRGAELAQEAEGVMPAAGFFSFVPVIVVAGLLSGYNAGLADAGLIAVAGAGGCAAFLMFNYPPARARTGHAGGAFMGALLCAAALAARMPVMLALCGAAYIAESVTALIAWLSERLVGKPLGAPLHRLLGRTGRNDIQLTNIFASITAVLGAISAALAVFTV